MITPAELAEKMKVEILADMKAGIVPRSVKSFSELHDYVDANCYGGTEALLDELDAVAPQTDEGRRGALDAVCDVMNPAMDIVTLWLQNGGAIQQASVIPGMSDKAANDSNLAAINRLVRTDKFHHIVAWGKLLGFTPATVNASIRQAELDSAPPDAIQKIDGKWLTVDDIESEASRNQVLRLAENTGRRL